MKNIKGFTLIELLVVIAIIAVIAGLVIIRVGGASEDAKKAKRKNDLTQTVKAIETYQINGGSLNSDIVESGGHQISNNNTCTVFASCPNWAGGDITLLECLGLNPDSKGKKILDYLPGNECPKDPSGGQFVLQGKGINPARYCLDIQLLGETEYKTCN
jgi:prepilin-type N-terminal cleavage/methylation domain-containing protein